MLSGALFSYYWSQAAGCSLLYLLFGALFSHSWSLAAGGSLQYFVVWCFVLILLVPSCRGFTSIFCCLVLCSHITGPKLQGVHFYILLFGALFSHYWSLAAGGSLLYFVVWCFVLTFLVPSCRGFTSIFCCLVLCSHITGPKLQGVHFYILLFGALFSHSWSLAAGGSLLYFVVWCFVLILLVPSCRGFTSIFCCLVLCSHITGPKLQGVHFYILLFGALFSHYWSLAAGGSLLYFVVWCFVLTFLVPSCRGFTSIFCCLVLCSHITGPKLQGVHFYILLSGALFSHSWSLAASHLHHGGSRWCHLLKTQFAVHKEMPWHRRFSHDWLNGKLLCPAGIPIYCSQLACDGKL